MFALHHDDFWTVFTVKPPQGPVGFTFRKHARGCRHPGTQLGVVLEYVCVNVSMNVWGVDVRWNVFGLRRHYDYKLIETFQGLPERP